MIDRDATIHLAAFWVSAGSPKFYKFSKLMDPSESPVRVPAPMRQYIKSLKQMCGVESKQWVLKAMENVPFEIGIVCLMKQKLCILKVFF